jgi:hypothetical protein
MQRGRESVGEMAMVVCESVRVCECVSLVGACAKLRKETNWAGLAWRGAGTHVWRRGRLSLALLQGGAKEGD